MALRSSGLSKKSRKPDEWMETYEPLNNCLLSGDTKWSNKLPWHPFWLWYLLLLALPRHSRANLVRSNQPFYFLSLEILKNIICRLEKSDEYSLIRKRSDTFLAPLFWYSKTKTNWNVFHFRWLEINWYYIWNVTFPISIMLFSNHLKYNSSEREKTIRIACPVNQAVFYVIISLALRSW